MDSLQETRCVKGPRGAGYSEGVVETPRRGVSTQGMKEKTETYYQRNREKCLGYGRKWREGKRALLAMNAKEKWQKRRRRLARSPRHGLSVLLSCDIKAEDVVVFLGRDVSEERYRFYMRAIG